MDRLDCAPATSAGRARCSSRRGERRAGRLSPPGSIGVSAGGANRGMIEDPLTRLVPIRFGREVCGTLSCAERREWWIANGQGGYAGGTVALSLTRRYHGLL